METNDKGRKHPERDKDFLQRFRKFTDRLKKREEIEAVLQSLIEEGENEYDISDQIIEPNYQHGYDTYSNIATTLSLKCDRLELIDTYQNKECPMEFGSTIVSGIESIAELIDYFDIDISNKYDLIDNLFQALSDYSSVKGFTGGADFKKLFDELEIDYEEKI